MTTTTRGTVAVNGREVPVSLWLSSPTTTTQSLCPDLLRLEQIGEADGIRGRVVRAFFIVLDLFDRQPWTLWWHRL